MNQITPFVFEGHAVRVVTVDDEPWFIAGDVCRHLDLANVGQAIASLDDDEKSSITIADGTPGNPNKAVITESGLYSLILRSRKSEAKAFKRWITHEVIPSIRKRGGYLTPEAAEKALTDPDFIIRLATDLKSERAARLEAEQRAKDLEVPAKAWGHMASSAGDYAVADAAKVLSRDPSITIGRTRLFKWMQIEGWIYRDQSGDLKAYQTQIDNGRLTEKLNRPYLNERTGETEVPAPTIRITPKGLAELHKRLGGTEAIVTVAEVA